MKEAKKGGRENGKEFGLQRCRGEGAVSEVCGPQAIHCQEPDEPPAAAAAAAAEEGEAGAAEDEARHLAQGSPVQQEKQASDERKKTWTSSCLKPFADSLSENVGDYFQDRLGQEL